MIKIKPGVQFLPATICDPLFWNMVFVAQATAPSRYGVTVTSAAEVCDEHPEGHPHGDGWMVDIRTRDADFNLAKWVARIQAMLGNRYRVVLASDHIHMQFNG